jgi:hypothetical protein
MEFTDFPRNCIPFVGEALSWDTLVGKHVLECRLSVWLSLRDE